MSETKKFYIDGQWVDPIGKGTHDVVNPATEEVIATIAMGNEQDLNAAVAAAKKAFPAWSQTTVEERLAILEKIQAGYQARIGEVADAISSEMGAPGWLANAAQAPVGLGHIGETIALLKRFQFEEQRDGVTVRKEPIGVCGFITPWNWPVNQIMCKVMPALAAGCTMVLKPSEMTPLNALILTEIFHDAGVPAGVFNLVNGDGPAVGAPLSAHPDIDMVSFTGSTRAGVLVAKSAADTVKRVTQELGGKSPNVILDDANLEKAVTRGIQHCFQNTGQSCNAPTRMLVPAARHAEALEIAKKVAEATEVGTGNPGAIGPLAHSIQFGRVQTLIQKGIDEGATLVAGGTGRPDGIEKGFYVKPTVFGGVTNDMTIAREEVFGPVLCILPYDDEEQAITIANDTPYGLAAYVQSENIEHATKVAARLRAGQVLVNGAQPGMGVPFGGYKQSGNGREWGIDGLEEFLETKAVIGVAA